MIIVKVINQKIVQVALASNGPIALKQHHQLPLLNQANLLFGSRSSNKHLLTQTANLVQSASSRQKVTNANNQYLIPIARNISFRQCNLNDRNQNTTKISPNSKLSFSISSAIDDQQQQAQFISADESIFIQNREEPERKKASAFDVLKKKAKDVVGKREVATKSKYYGQSFNETLSSTASDQRKLVVLMSWLEAKEKHIEKYRQFYLSRGYDVLNVKTSALDLLLPKIGAKKISKDFARFMIEKQYSDVLLHGFSVGGYMFGQVLLDIDKHEPENREKLLNSIRGLIFDSLVPFEGTCIGVANSITENKFLAKILEHAIRLYLYLGHSIATKYYLEASEKVWGGPLRCPSLFLSSLDDKISDYKIVERLANTWSQMGIECHKMVVEKSPHVQIYQKHQKDYVEHVEKFLRRIKMI